MSSPSLPLISGNFPTLKAQKEFSDEDLDLSVVPSSPPLPTPHKLQSPRPTPPSPLSQRNLQVGGPPLFRSRSALNFTPLPAFAAISSSPSNKVRPSEKEDASPPLPSSRRVASSSPPLPSATFLLPNLARPFKGDDGDITLSTATPRLSLHGSSKHLITKRVRNHSPISSRKMPKWNDNDSKEAPPSHPMDSFIRNATEIQTTLFLSRNGQSFALEKIGEGDHGIVYKVTSLEPTDELVPGIPNDQILIKVPKPNVMQRKNHIKVVVEQTLKQYHQMLLAGAPGIPFFNLDTLSQDGYFIVPKMVRPFDASREEDMAQMQRALGLFYAFGIPADAHNGWPAKDYRPAKSGNIMVDDQGLLFVIDYMEQEDEDIDSLLPKLLPTFGNEQVQLYLDPRIVDVTWDAMTDISSLEFIPTFFTQLSTQMRIAKNPEQFQKSISEMQQKLGLHLFSLPALKSLLGMKQHLKDLLMCQISETYSFLKFRCNGQIFSVLQFFKDQGIENVLDAISNGNAAVRQFLDPRV